MAVVNENLFNFKPGILSKDACIVIIHTEWNADIVNKLLDGCVTILKKYEMHNYKIVTVPGAFEIPFAVKNFWDTYQKKFEKPQAFIALAVCFAAIHLTLIMCARRLRMALFS